MDHMLQSVRYEYDYATSRMQKALNLCKLSSFLQYIVTKDRFVDCTIFYVL